ncbi:chemotaxis protein CheW [Undibacterium baiyunense]|uniref:Chemotaxis protein CheW n=1 Tax=Undibacterium baiyunense TaxID=2828731 RepID=A0A941DBK8_9BURK|nr:chemotaxis protein CheW [Undibacterium baiyunense]MBR7745240.1 chemotaxis protein CheW [Undibacterium baiyunense]
MKMAAVSTDVIQNFILCKLNDLQFVLPLEFVVQASEMPDDISQVPRRDGAVVGIFMHREQSIPLIDLRRWLPWPGDLQNMPAQILLLKKGEQSIGIAIDRVEGLQKTPSNRIQRLIHIENSDELFHSSIQIQQRRSHADFDATDMNQELKTVGVLDVPALIALSQIWSSEVAYNAVKEQSQSQDQLEKNLLSNTQKSLFASFKVGGQILAFATDEVAAVMSMPAIQKILGADANWLGLVKWRNRDVPVLATLPSIGLKHQDADLNVANLLLILKCEGRCVALPINNIIKVEALSLNAMQTVDEAGLPNNNALLGVVHLSDNSTALVISSANLIATCPMTALSETEDLDQKELSRNKEIFVVIQAGHAWAMNIQNLESIINVPEQIDVLTASHSAQIGTFVWNDKTLALWDLSLLSVQKPTEMNSQSKVLIARVGQRLIGLLIEKLVLLLPGRMGQVHNFSNPHAHTSQMITVKYEDHIKSYSILDPQNWTPLQNSIQLSQ